MNLKKVLVELSIFEVQQILAIDLDRDAEKALVFIRKNLAKQVKKALQPHWVPVFEASYGPAQKDRFARWLSGFKQMWPNPAPCFLEPMLWIRGVCSFSFRLVRVAISH